MCWATSFLRRRATSRRPCSSTSTPDTATSRTQVRAYFPTPRQAGTYVASNDGMLHAFNAETGKELWAYVPEMVLPESIGWPISTTARITSTSSMARRKLAIFAPPQPTTPCSGTQWKTIIVGGLNGGGKGYYALDITDPANPAVLWEFTNANMGYSYGNPRITKLKTGPWVVLLTSGYNNADGVGRLFVIHAYTGA